MSLFTKNEQILVDNFWEMDKKCYSSTQKFQTFPNKSQFSQKPEVFPNCSVKMTVIYRQIIWHNFQCWRHDILSSPWICVNRFISHTFISSSWRILELLLCTCSSNILAEKNLGETWGTYCLSIFTYVIILIEKSAGIIIVQC